MGRYMFDKLPAGFALVAVIVFGAPNAFASSSVCEQYPDIPQCAAPATGGGGGADEPAAEESVLASDGSTAVPDEPGTAVAGGEPGKAGDLPFTGYPLSPLVAVFLAALAAGLAIRAYLVIRRRLIFSAESR